MHIPTALFAHLPQGRPPDYADTVTIAGRTDLRAFLAGMFSASPAWLIWLYRLRSVLASVMGLRHAPYRGQAMTPGDVPMQAGQTLKFFTVTYAENDVCWVAMAEDTHLEAHLAVLAAPDRDGLTRFDVVTVVYYRRWTGPVYFALVRPFHLLVIKAMARAGIAYREGARTPG